MATDDTPRPDEIPAALLDAVAAAVGPWIRGRVTQLAADRMSDAQVESIVAAVSDRAMVDLRALLSLDVELQRANPLHVLRSAAAVATSALRAADVPPVQRDAVESESMPDDVYALGPFTWRDLSEDVHDAGITWGAWKAAVIISRRRGEGRS